jgi:hypothetical protein
MNSGSHLLAAAISLSALAACHSPKEPEKPIEPQEPVTTTVTVGRASAGINAVPTGERGIYRINTDMEQVTQVRIVSNTGDGAEGRPVEAGHWSFDRSTGRLRVDVPIDDANETVIALGTRARPPQVMLPAGVDLGSVRVIVGDRLGVEGQDYTIDRDPEMAKGFGPDTPENPLHYYIRATIVPDPAHPEMAKGFAIGNRGDLETIRRLLENGPH